MAENIIRTDIEFIAAEQVAETCFYRVVLRDDQLDLIREIVREEIHAALHGDLS